MLLRQVSVLTAVLAPLLSFATEYRHPDRNFVFQYDESRWEIIAPTERQTRGGEPVDRAMASMTLVNLQRKQPDDKYHARFSVVVDSTKKFSGGVEEQFTAYQKHATEFLKNQRFHILSTAPKRLPKLGPPAFEIVANQRDFGLKFRQIIFLKEGEAHLLTAAARTAKFVDYEKEIQGFFDSFQFQ